MNFTDKMNKIINNLKEMIDGNAKGKNCVNVNDLYEYSGHPYNYRQSLQGLEKSNVIIINGDRISLK